MESADPLLFDGTFTQVLARIGFKTFVNQFGAQEAMRHLNHLSNRNAARNRRALGVELASTCPELPDLDLLYRESVAWQLFGPSRDRREAAEQCHTAAEV